MHQKQPMKSSSVPKSSRQVSPKIVNNSFETEEDVDVEQWSDTEEGPDSSEEPKKSPNPDSSSSPSKAKKKLKEEKPKFLKPKCNAEELLHVDCFLETKELWDKFNELGTEMIITKTGRY